MDVVLAARGVRKRFGDKQALDGATVELRRGEWLGLLGPNGAGKTTLIRCIAGRIVPDEGTVHLLGRDPAVRGDDRKALAGGLGVVPQEVALYETLTARENLAAFGEYHGLGGAALRDRVGWALRWTGLEERADDRAGTYSGGMKRRLNIACGVLHRPDVVLLDEPTVGVDPQSRERIWEMLDGLRRDGASLLLTTHQLDEAQQICDRIVIIDHGRDIAGGTLAELIAQTVGPQRLATITVDRTPLPCQFGESTGDDSIMIDGNRLACRMRDIARELPALLSRIHEAGLRIDDVQIEAPSLQNVFLHLTGRELRE